MDVGVDTEIGEEQTGHRVSRQNKKMQWLRPKVAVCR
jgi:hypothetical protein